MQEWFNIHKPIIVITILTKKDKTHTVGGFFTVWATREAHKTHMIVSLEAEKAFDKIQHPFTIKILNKVGIERPYLSIKKAIIQIYSQYHTQQWKAKIFFSKIMNKTRIPILSTFIQHSIGRLNKGNQTTTKKREREEASKLEKKKYNCIIQMTWYYIRKIPKTPHTKKLLELINECSKDVRHKTNIQ